eukprot:CAMPEP_0119094480 /NCGR_PEP_ID=MMETSP1178-20130426/166358_1 /TAXON_ID=33656 /ORGANISM="unid sp, Strain CCMP2000" /LENGTH=53 /DNA_ID=CAMNT_0007078215 /DNA_START=17 /DNA_END=175 /DNA_ORIENTATION=+
MASVLVAAPCAFSGPTAEAPDLSDERFGTTSAPSCMGGPCGPGNEICGKPFDK